MITVDDPNVERLRIQLTTLHGDPDIFVSSKSRFPSDTDFELRSTNSGLYPDLVEYKVGRERTNLTATYYICVIGFMESTFTLEYFTLNANNTLSI
jgi:hypothetical protein